MSANTVLERIKARFMRNLKERELDWDVPTEIYTPELETINTELVTKDTVLICSTCNTHNHLKNNKCVKCDYLLP
jgi:ribosomal protein L40E